MNFWNCKSLPLAVTCLCAALLGWGCARPGQTSVARQLGESVVFFGSEPALLAHRPLPDRPIYVRSTYTQEQGTVSYVEGRDFTVDYNEGSLRRTNNSRLPDFHTNMLFGQEAFDHTRFPGFGNKGFFAFTDYSYKAAEAWPVQKSQRAFLKKSRQHLERGGEFRIVAFGDSITAGGDATRPELVFWQRWGDDLKSRYSRANITAVNGATIGDSTVQGLARLREKVLEVHPDLVLIGFGMNDHNVGCVPIPQFEANLHQMIDTIRSETGAEVILFSAFPPNPKWKFGTHRMEEYAAATARAAHSARCAYADVFTNWRALAARKKPEDLLGNNINHPNDFGHWIYFRVLQELGL